MWGTRESCAIGLNRMAAGRRRLEVMSGIARKGTTGSFLENDPIARSEHIASKYVYLRKHIYIYIDRYIDPAIHIMVQ